MRRRAARLASLDLNLIPVLRAARAAAGTQRDEGCRAGRGNAAGGQRRAAPPRRHFDDELLVRVNRGYILSPLVMRLQRQVEGICTASERLFSAGARFHPATTRREFTLIMADYTVDILGSRLSQLSAQQAPHASLHIRQVRESLAQEMPELTRLVDGIIAPERSQGQSPMRSAELFTDDWCPSTATRTRRSRPRRSGNCPCWGSARACDRGGKLPGRPPADRGNRPGRAAAAAAGDAVREPAQPAGLAVRPVPRRADGHRGGVPQGRAPRRCAPTATRCGTQCGGPGCGSRTWRTRAARGRS
jgi:hypothetical protein